MTDSLLSDQVLDGRYRIVRRIATGGMATVYLAEHVLIGRPVAIKVLHPQYAEDVECVQRFLAEGRTAGTLGHPHIVESTDMGYAASGAPYLVLELLEGRSLHDVIRAQGRMSIERAVTIALQIASAVAAAHARGIVHRDLKSENVFLLSGARDGDHAKVLDFGISKFTELRGSTKKDKVMGTPWFMPPEQVEDPSSVDARCDVYALGAILYEMLAGQTPFAEAGFPQVLVKILSEEPVPVERLRPQVGPELAAIVREAMRRELPERTASMDELGRALAALAGRSWPDIAQPARAASAPPAPILPPGGGRGRRLVVVALVGALIGVCAAIGAVVASRARSARSSDGDAPAEAVGPERPGEGEATGAVTARPAVEPLAESAASEAAGEPAAAPAAAGTPAAEAAEAAAGDDARTGRADDRSSSPSARGKRRDGGRRGERAAAGSGAAPEPSTPPDAEPEVPVVADPEPPIRTEPRAETPRAETPRAETPRDGTPRDDVPSRTPSRTQTPPRSRTPPRGQGPRGEGPRGEGPAPGTMHREATRRAVGRHLPEIRTCFERGRMDNPRLAGRVLVRIAVAPSGRVTAARIARSDVRNQQVESCIVSAVERWTLPRPAGGAAATITYPFSYH